MSQPASPAEVAALNDAIATKPSKYPDPITREMLPKWAHIPDDEIDVDIRETEAEIANLESTMCAERQLANSHPNPGERRMADFRAGARPAQIEARADLLGFLVRLRAARLDEILGGVE